MSTKQEIFIYDVLGEELPAEWAKQAGIAQGERVDVTISRIQPKRRKPTLEEIMPLVKKLQSHPVRNPNFRIEDLYDDETGAPISPPSLGEDGPAMATDLIRIRRVAKLPDNPWD